MERIIGASDSIPPSTIASAKLNSVLKLVMKTDGNSHTYLAYRPKFGTRSQDFRIGPRFQGEDFTCGNSHAYLAYGWGLTVFRHFSHVRRHSHLAYRSFYGRSLSMPSHTLPIMHN